MTSPETRHDAAAPIDPPASSALAVWWLDRGDFETVTRGLEGAVPLHWPPVELPAYIAAELRSAMGRQGRGRLWVAPGLGDARIEEWPATYLGRHCEHCVGIVLRRADLPALRDLPGAVTDLELRRL